MLTKSHALAATDTIAVDIHFIFHRQNYPRPFSKSVAAEVEIIHKKFIKKLKKLKNLIWCLIFFYFI